MSVESNSVKPAITSGNTINSNNSTYRLPNDITLQNAVKLSIVEDKPIMLDYWTACYLIFYPGGFIIN
jgi:hypothetical protein